MQPVTTMPNDKQTEMGKNLKAIKTKSTTEQTQQVCKLIWQNAASPPCHCHGRSQAHSPCVGTLPLVACINMKQLTSNFKHTLLQVDIEFNSDKPVTDSINSESEPKMNQKNPIRIQTKRRPHVPSSFPSLTIT